MAKSIVHVFLIVLCLAAVSGCAPKDDSQAERDYAEAGRAKTVEREMDLWQLYENPEVGFSFRYPPEVTLLGEDEYPEGGVQTFVGVQVIDKGEQPFLYSFTREQQMENMDALANGEFGHEEPFVEEASKNVKVIGPVSAQEFMVLGRFEVCDITLERTLLFYFNDKQITITLFGPVDTLMESMPGYFMTDPHYCGRHTTWDFEKKDDFYQALHLGKGAEDIQRWFDVFDQMAGTVTFDRRR